MNILLISQCSKNALTETRRILDQFAERRGDRSWQTAITQQGLDTLYRLLRKTARKNTAVACHWIRGKDHSELLWVVGMRGSSMPGGGAHQHDKRNILRRESENDWHGLQGIHLLTSLAAMLHDLGKACRAFQERLLPGAPLTRNVYRHEWISLRLFQAFVGDSTDDAWLQRLLEPSASDDASWLADGRLLRDGLDPPPAKASPSPSCRRWPGPWPGWCSPTTVCRSCRPRTKRSPSLAWSKSPDFRSEQLAGLLKAVDADWNELSDTSDRAAKGLLAISPRPAGDCTGMAQASGQNRQASARTTSCAPARDWCDDPLSCTCPGSA
jgi:CRISPR-associated endonuclease/helicase Cas3